MPRNPVEIDKKSAINIAKWRIGEKAKTEKDFVTKMMLQTALQPGGGVEQIAEILYGMGVRLSIDRNDPDHASWLSTGAAVEEG